MIRYTVFLESRNGSNIKTTIDAYDYSDLILRSIAMYPEYIMRITDQLVLK